MSIPYGSLSNDSLNNLDKPSSSKKNNPLPNGSLNNLKDMEPSTSKVMNVLNNKKEETSIPSSSHIAIIVDPDFQDPSLSKRTIVFSTPEIVKEEVSLNEEEKSQGISNPIVVTEDPQGSLLNEEVVISSKNEEERSRGIFKQIFCCVK